MCTKCIIRAAVIAVVSTISSSQLAIAETKQVETTQSNASQQAALSAQALKLVKGFGMDLKHTLVSSMKKDGPAAAIGVCNLQAPEIAAKHAQDSGWTIGRTSTKLRSDANAPDEWEAKVLAIFAQKKAQGGDLKTMQYSEIIEKDGKKTFRYMKAIGVAKPCLNCHGQNLKPAVTAALKDKYPDDAATGFKLGDLRGAFTLSKSVK